MTQEQKQPGRQQDSSWLTQVLEKVNSCQVDYCEARATRDVAFYEEKQAP